MASQSLQAMHLSIKIRQHHKPFLTRSIASQAVFTSHSRRNRNLLMGEVNGKLFSAHADHRRPNTTEQVCEEQVLARSLKHYLEFYRKL